jgi:hypothetical protein
MRWTVFLCREHGGVEDRADPCTAWAHNGLVMGETLKDDLQITQLDFNDKMIELMRRNC